MPTFLERLQKDTTDAMKAHDTVVVGTLRLLTTAIKNQEIAGGRKALTDEEVVSVIQREVKRRKEALELYTKGGSADRAEQEQAELDVLMRYMPEQMDAAGIASVVSTVVADMKPSGPADFGRVMGNVMKQLKGKADGATIQTAVKEALAKLPT